MNSDGTASSRPVLVTRFSSLGDIVLTEPATRAIKKSCPESCIHYLTKSHYFEIVEGFPAVDRVIAYDRHTGLTGLINLSRQLAKERYRLLIDLHGSLRSIIVRLLVQAGRTTRIRKRTLKRFLLVTFHAGREREWPTAVERYLECVPGQEMNPAEKIPTIGIGKRVAESTRRMMKAEMPRPGTADPAARPYIALAPGARWNTKMWPWERFAEVGAKLSDETGKPVVVLGSSEDRDLCERIISQIGDNASTLAGRTTLMEAGAVLASCGLLITNDSGLMHLAVGVRTPVVAIFGPTSRELGFFPDSEFSSVLETDLACRPCHTKGSKACPIGTHECMQRITTNNVASEALRLLDKRRAVTA